MGVHINSIFASVLSVLVAVALIWGLWNPVILFFGIMPTDLELFAKYAFFIVVAIVVFAIPIMMAVSDDA